MKKLNVAVAAACPLPANRGTPSRILRMAEAVSYLGHNVHIVTYHFGLDIQSRGIEIHRIPRFPYTYFAPGPTFTKLLILDPLLLIKLLKVVTKRKIDLIHAHHFEGALVGYMVRKLTGIRVIYDAHTTLESELDLYHFVNPKWLANLLDRKVPQWADHIIAVSSTLEEFLVNTGVAKNKIDVIPNGVSLVDFDGKDPNVIRRKYNLQDSQIVMYTGSLAAFQEVDYLIEAMEKVTNKHNDVVLVLVGNSGIERYKKMCSRSETLKNVLLVGEQTFKEIPFFLASADVVVSPRTRCPGMPQKLVNYMAAQKAIVSFEGSAKLLINGYNGMIVQNGNTTAMADSISRLLGDKDLREQLGRNARLTIENRYDWDSLCRRVEEIYYRSLHLCVTPI